MQTVFTCIGVALGLLFAVAVAVTAWEHYRLLASRLQDWPEPPPSDHVPLAVKVDVDVENFAKLPPPQGDAADRRATLERTLGNLAQAPAGTGVAANAAAAATATARPPIRPPSSRPLSWVDTEPMVGPGPRAEPVYPPVKVHNS